MFRTILSIELLTVAICGFARNGSEYLLHLLLPPKRLGKTMVKPDASDNQSKSEVEHVAEQVISSEKREDIWAIIIAVGILVLSFGFPEQIRHFFTQTLYLF